ncbi:MAG: DNA replication/repair protein RecF, partial [Lentisphaeria bacterium]|nr:DNA replication/repair protein RecF [Lentisphaeria bacterium]
NKSKKNDLDILSSYSVVLAAAGSEIIQKRGKYAALLETLMKELFADLCPSLSDFQIRMRYARETEDKDSYFKKLERDTQRDFLRGAVSCGPHLDDFEFVFDNKPMRSFGSRGQCRMTSLILKLAQLEAVRHQTGALQDTVVLVDDATADLDLRARTAFLEKIGTAGQIFFAFTEIPAEFQLEKSDKFKIQSGSVKKND